jgi:cytidine deaminase
MLTDAEIGVLIDHALRVRECAYAPYSGFRVGAAAIDEENRVFFGSNVENASYGVSLCAERAAIAAAVAGGAARITAIVLATDSTPPAVPCGACLQWMAELGDPKLQIIAANTDRQFHRYTLKDLLPSAFVLKRGLDKK